MKEEFIKICQLVYFERYCRDRGFWEKMHTAYHPESSVHISWFQGSGYDFVEASKKLTNAPSKHRLSPSIIRIKGKRALAETDAVIELRLVLNDIEIDVNTNCRLFSRVRCDEGIWRLASYDVIYEKDMIKPVNPNDQLEIDNEKLQLFRPCCKFLSYIIDSAGRPVNGSILGDDMPDSVDAFYKEAEDWMME